MENKQIENETCSRCGRKLKTQKSILDGFGPVCKRKHDADMEKADQTIQEHKEYNELYA